MAEQKENIWRGCDHELLTRSWAEVDLDRLAANTRLLRSRVRRSCEIMGVVKADAYGHGVLDVVPVLLANGVSRLAVAMLDEAIELRQAGVDVPILVLGYTDPRRVEEILTYRITQTVFSRDLAIALSEAAVAYDCAARIHIKVDTGMCRLGFTAGHQAFEEISFIHALPHIVVEGLYTHFASADEADPAYTRQQFAQFQGLSQELERMGLTIPLKHVCNSAATMRFPDMHLDMIRPGLILYGMTPSRCTGVWSDLLPSMCLKSRVIQSKTVPAGSSVSYGRKFVTQRESRIATIAVGYADGYPRRLSGRAQVQVHGRRVPVIGNICMDTCMIDVTQIEDHPVLVGDEVILFAPPERQVNVADNGLRQEKQTVTASPPVTVDEVASWLDTINYEVTCLIGRRVPRAFLLDGAVVSIQQYLRI